MTHDLEFENWANLVWDLGAQLGDEEAAVFRKDIIIDILNEAGQRVLSYNVYRCWVSEYQALPDLDANAIAIAIEYIKIQNEGWARASDADVGGKEPTKPG